MSDREVTTTPLGKAATVAVFSTAIEWYDFFIYGTAAALVFPKLFFPADLPPLVALLAAFSTFAVGFIARPVGGIAFGHFGDRAGRKKALIVALLLMGGSTTIIGFLPSYQTAGALAPLLLVVLRFAQGLAIGGQWGGAVLLVTEGAPKNRRGFYGSFAQVGITGGVILANLVFLLASANLSPDEFISWGWRLPFIFSIVLIFIALYVQLKFEDTPAFQELKKRQAAAAISALKTAETPKSKSPILDALRMYPREIAYGSGACLALQVTFYILLAFVVAYGTDPQGLSIERTTILTAIMIGAAAMAPAIIISAIVSDHVGRRGTYMFGAAFLAVWSFVMFPLMETKSFLWISVGISGGFVGVGIMYGPQAAFFSEMFKTSVRYSAASLSYQIGAIIGGSFAPFIATALFAHFGSTFPISVYMVIACVITFMCVWALNETHRDEIS